MISINSAWNRDINMTTVTTLTVIQAYSINYKMSIAGKDCKRLNYISLKKIWDNLISDVVAVYSDLVDNRYLFLVVKGSEYFEAKTTTVKFGRNYKKLQCLQFLLCHS